MKMLMDGVDMMLNRNLLYMEKILSVIVLLNRLKDTTHSSWTRNQPQNSLPARDDLIGPSTCQSHCRTQQCLQDQMVLIQRLEVSETIRSPKKMENNPAGVRIAKKSLTSQQTLHKLLLNVSVFQRLCFLDL